MPGGSRFLLSNCPPHQKLEPYPALPPASWRAWCQLVLGSFENLGVDPLNIHSGVRQGGAWKAVHYPHSPKKDTRFTCKSDWLENLPYRSKTAIAFTQRHLEFLSYCKPSSDTIVERALGLTTQYLAQDNQVWRAENKT
jgi:hypothetical protein